MKQEGVKMKTKVMMVASIIIAAMSSPLEAGPHGGGGGFGGGFGGGHFGGGFGGARPGAGFARPGMAPSMHAMPMQRFGGHQMMYSGQRFSSVQTHSHYSA
jgi:hypothetical protein